MSIGVLLKKGFIEEVRPILYMYEEIRRYIQRNGYDIEVIIDTDDLNNKLFFLSGLVIQDDSDVDVDIPYIRIDNLDKINELDLFFTKCIKNNNSYKNNGKTIGVTCRYYELDNPVIYISNKVVETFRKAFCTIRLIIPVQDISYPITRGKDFPVFSDLELDLINKQISMVNGLVFPGGYKFTPFDRYIFDYAVDKDIPVLGICLGMQLISCFDMDIEIVPIETGVNHKQESDLEFSHYVNINKNSLLYSIVGCDRIKVNSFHRMTVTDNDNLKIVALSDDGIIEGIEFPNKKFILGIQWHPEISYNIDESSKKIIDYFVEVL